MYRMYRADATADHPATYIYIVHAAFCVSLDKQQGVAGIGLRFWLCQSVGIWHPLSFITTLLFSPQMKTRADMYRTW